MVSNVQAAMKFTAEKVFEYDSFLENKYEYYTSDPLKCILLRL